MKTVDPKYCTKENYLEMEQTVGEMTELNDKFKDNVGRSLKVTEQTPEGKFYLCYGSCWVRQCQRENYRVFFMYGLKVIA